MLVLSRFDEEVICIGDDIRVTVIRAVDGKVRLGFEAPDEVRIYREEIYLEIQDEKERTSHAVE